MNLYFEKLTTVYICCMVTVFLLFTGYGGYEEITQQKYILFCILSGGYLIVALLLRVELMFVGAEKGCKKPKDVWRSFVLPQKLIIGFWLMTAISTLFAVDMRIAFFGGTRFEGFVTITLYCGCLFTCIAIRKIRKADDYNVCDSYVNKLHIAIAQLAGYNPLKLYPQGMTYYDAYTKYSGEFLGTIGNADLMSAVLCIAIPIFWISIVKSGSRYRTLLFIPLVLCLAVLIKAYVEGGIVGIIGSIIITIPVITKKREVRRILTIILILVMIAAFVGIYFCGSAASGFIYEASELLHGHFDDSFGSGRIYIWRNVIKLLDDRLLLGGGPDTLPLRGDIYFERFDDNLGIMLHSTVDTAHNEYLNILVNQGLIAFVLYLAALIISAVKWAALSSDNAAAAVLGGAVLGYCIQAFFGISSPVSGTVFLDYFWSICRNLETITVRRRGKNENYQ